VTERHIGIGLMSGIRMDRIDAALDGFTGDLTRLVDT